MVYEASFKFWCKVLSKNDDLGCIQLLRDDLTHDQ